MVSLVTSMLYDGHSEEGELLLTVTSHRKLIRHLSPPPKKNNGSVVDITIFLKSYAYCLKMVGLNRNMSQ
jgi:hypothetical protein